MRTNAAVPNRGRECSTGSRWLDVCITIFIVDSGRDVVGDVIFISGMRAVTP